ncbi:MAG: hypothetical protein O7I93_14460, partial [Gemmatimonadetes bacterium]|nr:hypothetical protein [Gemmatimonadota bacterium]
MSPEQAAARGGPDEKTDVYSLGCVFYELLIGETPGMWVTDECVELGRFVEATPEHRAKLDRLSGSVEQALVHALALRPEHRFDSPNEFMGAVESRDPRKYSATRVLDIVKRASENEAEQPETVDGALSLGGVQRLGAEVGIPVRQVRRALRELDQLDRSAKMSRFLGEAHVLMFERVVDGELPESEYPVLVEEIRVTVGNVGIVSTLGKTFAWHWDGGVERAVHVTVHPRGGQTRIRVEERLGNMAGGLFGGIMGGAGGGGGVPLTAVLIQKVGLLALAFGAWGLLIGGTHVLARTIFTHVVRRRREQLRGLADRLAAHAEDVI